MQDQTKTRFEPYFYRLPSQDVHFLAMVQLTAYLNRRKHAFTVYNYEIILQSSGHSVRSTISHTRVYPS
jgi:hypothetical protein